MFCRMRFHTNSRGEVLKSSTPHRFRGVDLSFQWGQAVANVGDTPHDSSPVFGGELGADHMPGHCIGIKKGGLNHGCQWLPTVIVGVDNKISTPHLGTTSLRGTPDGSPRWIQPIFSHRPFSHYIPTLSHHTPQRPLPPASPGLGRWKMVED